MNIDFLIQVSVVLLSICLLLLKKNGMKRYIPLGLFVIVYANVMCYAAEYFHLWNYPTRLIPYTVISVPFNYIVVPIGVMFWMRYCPINAYHKVTWAFGWSVAAVIGEYILSRYTTVIVYSNGFHIYYSFILWLISWYVFYKFHNYITYDKFFEK